MVCPFHDNSPRKLLRAAKITNHDVILLIQEDIGWFYVLMNDIPVVEVFDSFQNLPEDPQDFLFGDWLVVLPGALEEVLKITI